MTPTLALTGQVTKTPVENNSDCMLIAVTIMKVDFHDDGALKEMALWYHVWLEPGETDTVELEDGEYYYMLVEAFKWDAKAGKAVYKIGEQVKEGYHDHTRPHADKIDVRCSHTALQET